MADKTFTEDEHLAILADRVEKETAQLVGEKASLSEEKAELEKQLASTVEAKDAEIASLTARLEEAEGKLAEAEAEKARVELAEKRIEAAKKAAPHVAAEYFTPERAKAYAKLDEDAFAVVLDSLGGRPAATPELASRELAASGAPLGGDGEPAAVVPAATTFLGSF